MSTNLLALLNGEFQSSLFPKNLCALCGNLTMEEPRVRSRGDRPVAPIIVCPMPLW